MNWLRVLFLFGLTIALGGSAAFAQSAENVAVIINERSSDSREVGEHYARVRRVPAANIIRIEAPTEETVDRDTYLRHIERPIATAIGRASIQDRLLYIVLTKGIPHRIQGTPGLNGTESSVDSELTLLYRRLAGEAVPTDGPIDNPYFLGDRDLSEARLFTHRDYDIFLVTRLDAFTAKDAIALVDRAQTPDTEGRIVLDQRVGGAASVTGDEWLRRAAERLSAAGHERRLLFESTAEAARTADPVLGLYTWGAADPAQRRRKTGLTFARGGIAANLASFDARTFREPPADWRPTGAANRAAWFEGTGDGLIGDLIREGISGVSGQAGEAFLRGAIRPDILFAAYLSGFNLAESFYLALPVLSWQSVVIGDPLAAPFRRNTLPTSELGGQDTNTMLPEFFAARRMSAVARANRDVPRDAIAPYLRAITLISMGDEAAAVRALSEAVTRAPQQSAWLTMLATLQEEVKDYHAAAATYEAALKLEPGNVIALNNLAYLVASRLGRPAEAMPLAQRALLMAPRAPSIIDTVAWIEHLLGNNETAARMLEDAIQIDPRHAEIRLHAAMVYAASRDPVRAATQLKEALRLAPSFSARDDVRELQAKLASRQNR